MSPRIDCVIFIICLVVIDLKCEICSDKRTRKLKYFDVSRRNETTTTDTSCAINYFAADSVAHLMEHKCNAKHLRHLDLSGNKISTIHNDTLNQFVELEILVLDDNFLTEIRSHYFNGLKKLSSLDVSSNLIQHVEENSFLMLEALKALNLADNCIIDLGQSAPVVSVEKLSLNNNEISNLTQLQFFINVAELNMANNLIGNSENILPRLTKLRKLDLANTNLTSLAIFNVTQCEQLAKLSIEKNPMKINFDSLRNFSNLQHLQFSMDFCYKFDSYRDIRSNFPRLTHVSILYDEPNCKCARTQTRSFSLNTIEFHTDRKHMCSGGQSSMKGQRHNGVIYFFGLIVFRALLQLNV